MIPIHLEATTHSLNDDTSDLVRISVGRGATILKVTLAVLGALAGDTDRATTVGNTVRELIDVTGLVATGETLLVTLTVDGNVLNVTGLELLHGGLNNLHTTLGTSGVGGNVGVKTGTVPLTLDGLGLEGDTDTELLSNTVEKETGHPEVITHIDTGARADLVLPLGRHDLSVDTGDVDTGVQAGTVVSLDDITAVDLAGTDTAVVRTLGTGETATGPAVRPSISTEESVLLLQTEPEALTGVGLHQTVGFVTVVELVGASIGIPGLAEDEDVVTLAEGVGVVSDGAKVDIGVVTGSLVGGGTVKVPFGELINTCDGLGQSLCLRTSATVGINPNVFSLNATTLVKVHVLHEIPRVGDDSCRFRSHNEYGYVCRT
jgi:hypothetical protein